MKKHISNTEIMNMEKQERVHFINSLGGFKSVSLLGTVSSNNQPNLAIFSSIFHIGANPPLIGVIFRPIPAGCNTLNNILQTGFYTINHITENIYKQAHQTSARYDDDISEFEVTGLQSEYKNNFKAPFVRESNVQIGIEFKEKIELTINHTILIIGEIKEVYFPESCLAKDGYLDLEKANTITCTGLDSYHKTQRLDRLSYAKPHKEITSIL